MRVDWASEKHDVLIGDETGEEILAATFAHDEPGLRSLCRTLVRHEVTLVRDRAARRAAGRRYLSWPDRRLWADGVAELVATATPALQRRRRRAGLCDGIGRLSIADTQRLPAVDQWAPGRARGQQ
jgi:hypothetical protein